MDYYKLQCKNFGNFVKNSRIKLENNVYDDRLGIFRYESQNLLPSFVRKIINNLDILTQEDKIIWSKSSDDSFRGIVTVSNAFSNYRIIIEKWDFDKYFNCDLFESGHNECNYKISFIKGILTADKIEYISNLKYNNNEMQNLFITIERKLLQERN